MNKPQDTDPFLAQVSVMLVILLVIFLISDSPGNLDHLMLMAG